MRLSLWRALSLATVLAAVAANIATEADVGGSAAAAEGEPHLLSDAAQPSELASPEDVVQLYRRDPRRHGPGGPGDGPHRGGGGFWGSFGTTRRFGGPMPTTRSSGVGWTTTGKPQNSGGVPPAEVGYPHQPPEIPLRFRQLYWWQVILMACAGVAAIYFVLDFCGGCYAYHHPESWLFGRKHRPRSMRMCPRIFRPEKIDQKEEQRRFLEREKRLQALAKLENESDNELAVDWGKKETKLKRLCKCFQGVVGLTEMRMFKLIFFAVNGFIFLVGMFSNFAGPTPTSDNREWWQAWGYPMAKAFGFMLDFEFAFIVLPTMEIIQTMLRSVGTTRQWLPVDDPIGVHVLTAWYIAVASVGHIAGHAVNISYIWPDPDPSEADEGAAELLGLDASWLAGGGTLASIFFDPSYRCAPFTGLLLVFHMAGIYITALPGVRRGAWAWARRRGGYKLFWRLHRSWPLLFLMLLIHSPQRLWIWLFFPAMLLAIDRMLGNSVNKYYAALKKAKLLPHDVLSLTFALPEGFRYTAGQYIFLQWNKEWHPFTLTSAPEEDHLSVHIRASKDLDWCSALRRRIIEEAPKELWSEAKDRPRPGSVVHYKKASSPMFNKFYCVPTKVKQGRGGYVGAVMLGNEDVRGVVVDKTPYLHRGTLDSVTEVKLPEEAVPLKIAGPYGAPAQKVWLFDVIMVVGSGIGITPFISILRSTQIKAQQRQAIIEKAPRDVNLQMLDRTIPIPRRIHFYWIVRTQEELNWFLELLTAAVQGPAQGIIDIKLFATKEVESAATSSIACSFEKFTGRPNWNKIFVDVEEQNHGQHIGVFLCGNPAIGQELQKMCALHTDVLLRDGAPASDARGTQFSFFSEHF